MNKISQNIRPITNLLAIVAAFIVNVFANLNPPQGMTIGDISNQLFGNVLITPANYAFAIWGIIYLALISFGIYQVLPSQKDHPILNKLGYKIAIASLCQILWIFCFLSQQFALSLVLMLGILIALIWGYLDLPSRWNSLKQKWLIKTPLSIYLAWISVATIVNGAIVLEYYNWNGWGLRPEIWTVIMLIITSMMGAILAVRKNLPFTGVYLWALIAIAVRNLDITMIAATAIIGAIVLTLILLISTLVKKSEN